MARTLTVGRLYKILGKMIEQGHARTGVYVSKQTFADNRESDGCTILPAYDCRVKTIHLADDDGGIAKRADGSERYRTMAILFGCSDEGDGT